MDYIHHFQNRYLKRRIFLWELRLSLPFLREIFWLPRQLWILPSLYLLQPQSYEAFVLARCHFESPHRRLVVLSVNYGHHLLSVYDHHIQHLLSRIQQIFGVLVILRAYVVGLCRELLPDQSHHQSWPVHQREFLQTYFKNNKVNKIFIFKYNILSNKNKNQPEWVGWVVKY